MRHEEPSQVPPSCSLSAGSQVQSPSDDQSDMGPSGAAVLNGSGGKGGLRLQQAVERERLLREDATEEEAAYKRQLAADFIIQLAAKRGTTLRPASVGPAQNIDLDEDVPGLLAQHPELCDITEEKSYEISDMAARMLWYDELPG